MPIKLNKNKKKKKKYFCEGKNVYEHEANVCCVGCVFFTVFSHDFTNKQACIFFCNNS